MQGITSNSFTYSGYQPYSAATVSAGSNSSSSSSSCSFSGSSSCSSISGSESSSLTSEAPLSFEKYVLPEEFKPLPDSHSKYSDAFYDLFRAQRTVSERQEISLKLLADMPEADRAKLPMFDDACLQYRLLVQKAINEVSACQFALEKIGEAEPQTSLDVSSQQIPVSPTSEAEPVDLGQVNVAGMNLQGADLTAVDFAPVYPGGVNLNQADFNPVDLTNVNLGEPDERAFGFLGADLTKAQIGAETRSSARLLGAVFTMV